MRQPREIETMLRALCLPGLTRRQLQILGACALGYSADEIASGLSISRPTVFRHIELLEARLFEFADLIPSRHLLSAWTHIQRDCCAQGAWRLIETDSLFECPRETYARVAV